MSKQNADNIKNQVTDNNNGSDANNGQSLPNPALLDGGKFGVAPITTKASAAANDQSKIITSNNTILMEKEKTTTDKANIIKDGQINQTATIANYVPVNLTATIAKDVPANLTATIAKDAPTNLTATIAKDVPANQAAITSSDVPVNLTATITKDVPANQAAITSSDVPVNLTATITKDVPANQAAITSSDVPVNLTATITKDVPANQAATTSSDVPVNLTATITKGVPANQAATTSSDVPVNLTATITKDVPANQAATTSSDVPANLTATIAKDVPANQAATTSCDVPTNLNTTTSSDVPVNLTATITKDGLNNPAPKAINAKTKSRFRKIDNISAAEKAEQERKAKIKEAEKAKMNQYKEKLMEMKQNIKLYFDNIVMNTYPTKIVEFRQFQVECLKEIHDILTNQPLPTIIPLAPSLSDQLAKIESQPNQVEKWIKVNPDLQCFQLRQRPLLYKGCKLETNKRISVLVEKFCALIRELDQDMRGFHCAAQLMLPKMRDGEFIGAQLLIEIKDKIDSFIGVIEKISIKLLNYHSSRHMRIQNVLQFNHMEDHRLLLDRFDQRYCLTFRRCLHDVYRIYVVFYDFIKKNYNKMSEFKNMNDDDSFDSSTDCSFYY